MILENLHVSAPGLIAFAGGLILVSGVVSSVISVSFCTRAAHRGIRGWRDVALAVVGARLLTRDNVSLDVDAYWVALMYINLGIAQSVVAGSNVWSILPPRSDRCDYKPKNPPLAKVGMVLLPIVFIGPLVALVLGVV